MLAANNFQQALRTFNMDWKPVQQFSCEIKASKRAFMETMFGDQLGHVFSDCVGLGDHAFDYRSEGRVRVDSADELTAGFPCDDVSAMNGAATENRRKVQQGQLLVSCLRSPRGAPASTHCHSIWSSWWGGSFVLVLRGSYSSLLHSESTALLLVLELLGSTTFRILTHEIG